MKKDIYISVTDRCNLGCSFCSATQEMTHRSQSIESMEASLVTLRETTDIGVITWGGGEPLLAPKRLFALLDRVAELWPTASHRLVTNGYYLSKQPLENLDRFNTVLIGVDGYQTSERPLTYFLKEDYDFFERVSQLQAHTAFRHVVVRQQLLRPDWWVDLYKLHTLLAGLPRNQLELRVTLDCYQDTPLTSWETDNFIAGFKNLKVPRGSTNVVLDKVFINSKCDCGDVLATSHTARTFIPGAIETELPYGCALLERSIGQESYQRIAQEFQGVTND